MSTTTSTTTTTTTTTTILAPSILEPSGTIWTNSDSISNSFFSGTSGINDFSTFKPYIHNSKINNNLISINTSRLLQFSTLRFNRYLDSMRTSGPITVTSTTTSQPPFDLPPRPLFPGF